jgi:uncharacterized protein YchJ
VRRYVAAGRKGWLHPEETISQSWSELRKTLFPSKSGLVHFGGEMFAKFQSGDVYYQDEFGRAEKPRDFLLKELPAKPPRPGDLCGCGSGTAFKECCQSKPATLRPAWNERSIRERNRMFKLLPNFEITMYLAQATGAASSQTARFAGLKSKEPACR